MANKPFDYTIIHPLERPTSKDINQLQAQAHYDTRQFAYELFGRQNGFLGFSFNAEPNSTPDDTFWVQQGVAFQYGDPENNIDGIAGLSDSYRQKAATIENRRFTDLPNPPTLVGQKRYDLLMIRAPKNTERLADPTDVGIFNPTLGSFGTGVEKPKTLTASLTSVEVEYVVEPAVGTTPVVYKSGIAGVHSSWTSVPKPTVDIGYLAVAYIRRYSGQTAITAGDIEDARILLTVPVQSGGSGNFDLPAGEVLLGNGSAGITSTAILPVSKGGTGNDAAATYTGSVAWFDTADEKLKYTQAQSDFFPFAPVTGRLLASNASGAPTWIGVGAAGTVLTSTGSAWQAQPLPPKVTVYDNPGVFTHPIPTDATFVKIICIGGGGGGGGGTGVVPAFPLPTVALSGAGGGGGGLTVVSYNVSTLLNIPNNQSTLRITVGAGGAGGPGGYQASGQVGGNGDASEVVMLLSFPLPPLNTDRLAYATGGFGGEIGTLDTIIDGGAGGVGATGTGGKGGNSGVVATGEGSPAEGGGGGGGGGIANDGSGGDGGSGGAGSAFIAVNPGGVGGAPGVDGGDAILRFLEIGGGGGGGGGFVVPTPPLSGKKGGNGALGGGGGGAGSVASSTSATGGDGGNGGNGLVIICEW